MNKLFIISIIFLMIGLVGCRQTAVEPSAPQEAAGQSIEETSEITEIQDTEVEKELDDIGSVLDNW